jgi:chromosome segregation ATPase
LGRIAKRRGNKLGFRYAAHEKENYMSERKTGRLFKLVAVMFFTCCLSQIAVGQNQQSDDKETLKALLAEVTMLRQALQSLQRMSLDTYRSQLMVDRIRVNQEDVRHLTTALNETRDTLAKIQVTIPRLVDEQKRFESQIQLEVDAEKRAMLEFELKRSREAVESYKSQTERLREREQEFSSALKSAQTKLDDLESRLNLLERGIDSERERLQSDKSDAARKP